MVGAMTEGDADHADRESTAATAHFCSTPASEGQPTASRSIAWSSGSNPISRTFPAKPRRARPRPQRSPARALRFAHCISQSSTTAVGLTRRFRTGCARQIPRTSAPRPTQERDRQRYDDHHKINIWDLPHTVLSKLRNDLDQTGDVRVQFVEVPGRATVVATSATQLPRRAPGSSGPVGRHNVAVSVSANMATMISERRPER
jgi:hypothetical protein